MNSPKVLCYEVLLEQVIATDKPIILCDWFLLCKTLYIYIKYYCLVLLSDVQVMFRECRIYVKGDIFINGKL